jgi:hypothetical protein
MKPIQGKLNDLARPVERASKLQLRQMTRRSRSANGHFCRSQSRDEIPEVVPSIIIPPPSRGPQYERNETAGPWSTEGGIGGGGNNRGGAFNLFTAGGFFGPNGGRFILKRIMLLVTFFAWTTFLSLMYHSLTTMASQLSSSWTSARQKEQIEAVTFVETESSECLAEAVSVEPEIMEGRVHSHIHIDRSGSFDSKSILSRSLGLYVLIMSSVFFFSFLK